MIYLPNDERFCWKVASGALGYDGYGWWWDKPFFWTGLLQPELFVVTTKSLTRYPKKGNLRWHDIFGFGCVRRIKNGWVNAVGLTNPGIEWWCKKIGPKVSRKKIKLIVSIVGDTEELAEMADMLNQFDIVAIEVNVSCPNTGEMPTTTQIIEGVHAVRQRSRHPVIFKGSVAQDLLSIAPELRGIASAFELNSVPWHLLYSEEPNPLARFKGGGVSGKPAQDRNWPMLRTIAEEHWLPVIGGSVMRYEDIPYLFDTIGVDAISFGSIHMPSLRDPSSWLNPIKPTRFVRRYEKENPNL